MDIATFLGMRYNDKEEQKLELGEIMGGDYNRRSEYLKVAERMPDIIPEMKLCLSGLRLTVKSGSLIDPFCLHMLSTPLASWKKFWQKWIVP